LTHDNDKPQSTVISVVYGLADAGSHR
jgi:hypothetical protein